MKGFPTRMALRLSFVLLLWAVSLVAESSAGETTAHWAALTRYGASGDGGLYASRKCDGLVGDCIEEEDEMGMESESTRRVLAGGQRHISYAALNKNRVPCKHRGQPYYSCRAGKANPYHRGCSRITKCQRYTD